LEVSNIDRPFIPYFAYHPYDRPKEAFMGGHPFPEIPCTVCRKPVDLAVDLYADEHGKAVHEDCYVTRMLVTQWRESKIVL
jgi:hypothetical protein